LHERTAAKAAGSRKNGFRGQITIERRIGEPPPFCHPIVRHVLAPTTPSCVVSVEEAPVKKGGPGIAACLPSGVA